MRVWTKSLGAIHELIGVRGVNPRFCQTLTYAKVKRRMGLRRITLHVEYAERGI